MPDLSRKIFDVSLPRTGTHSQTQALQRLGFTTFHNHGDAWRHCLCGRLPFRGLPRFDALTHFGHFNVEQLAQAYPKAVFLHRVRDLESWLMSHEAMTRQEVKDGKHDPMTSGNLFYTRIATFGMVAYDRDNREEVWHRHNDYIERVRAKGIDVRPVELSWESLCPALDLPVRDDPFPRTGVSSKGQPSLVPIN